MHKYWCLKTEALKSNCKDNTLISIVDLDLRHAIHGTHIWQIHITVLINIVSQVNKLSTAPHTSLLLNNLTIFPLFH